MSSQDFLNQSEFDGLSNSQYYTSSRTPSTPLSSSSSVRSSVSPTTFYNSSYYPYYGYYNQSSPVLSPTSSSLNVSYSPLDYSSYNNYYPYNSWNNYYNSQQSISSNQSYHNSCSSEPISHDYSYSSYPLHQNYDDSIASKQTEDIDSVKLTSSTKFQENTIPKSMTKQRTIARKAMLPDSAVELLNQWYENNINNPYPDMATKEELAIKGEITIKQVNAWFSNRRNRTQNTKPKKIKREMESKITGIFKELTSHSSSNINYEIIEKVKSIIR